MLSLQTCAPPNGLREYAVVQLSLIATVFGVERKIAMFEFSPGERPSPALQETSKRRPLMRSCFTWIVALLLFAGNSDKLFSPITLIGSGHLISSLRPFHAAGYRSQ
ncbi:MAG: hypothetical protein ACKO4U_16175, partial [Caldilinea sp.]